MPLSVFFFLRILTDTAAVNYFVSFLCGNQVKRGNEVNKKMGVDQQCRSVQVRMGVVHKATAPLVLVDSGANQSPLVRPSVRSSEAWPSLRRRRPTVNYDVVTLSDPSVSDAICKVF